MKNSALNLSAFFIFAFLLICKPVSAAIDFSKPPESLEELVRTSDVILTGRLDEIIDNSLFYGYQKSAEELRKLDQQTPMQIGIYKTDFRLKVNKTLKGDVDEKSMVVRVSSPKIIDINESNINMKKNKNKIKKQVFFLRKNPDNTYSINTIMGVLLFKKTINDKGIEEEKIVFKSNNKDIIPFGKDYDAQSFLDEISMIGQ